MSRRIGVKINPEDNVVTVVDDVAEGDEVQYVAADGAQQVTALGAIPFGHKIAAEDISLGEKIVKYNQTIATASSAIERGEHVHVHNVRSAVQGAESEG